jgi:hypothetical protein
LLYRGLDRLLAHKAAVEAHLSGRCGEPEGQAEANPQAQRGYSREHRPDCAQVRKRAAIVGPK